MNVQFLKSVTIYIRKKESYRIVNSMITMVQWRNRVWICDWLCFPTLSPQSERVLSKEEKNWRSFPTIIQTRSGPNCKHIIHSKSHIQIATMLKFHLIKSKCQHIYSKISFFTPAGCCEKKQKKIMISVSISFLSPEFSPQPGLPWRLKHTWMAPMKKKKTYMNGRYCRDQIEISKWNNTRAFTDEDQSIKTHL